MKIIYMYGEIVFPDGRNDRKEWGSSIIVTNLDHVPGRKIIETLGIVFGYASGSSEEGELTALFKKAEKDLIESGENSGADAVVGIKGNIGRTPGDDPEIMLIGTGVILDDLGNEEGGMSVTMDGQKSEWTIPPASPSEEVVRLIRERDRTDHERERERKDIYDLADEIGISYDRAKLLMDNGYKELEDISEASYRALARIEGINPTQARILQKKAREILDKERGL
jgi:uncharacterized protein YbjQ (UPF0145 family)